jgi:protein TonB
VTTTAPPPAPQLTRTIATTPTAVAVVAPKAAVPSPAPPIPGFTDLNSCKPDYPHASLLAEEQGTVRIQFIIGIDNQLIETKVVKSSGYKSLDKATVNALSHCKFKSGYLDGKPVQSSFTAEYVWKLDQ